MAARAVEEQTCQIPHCPVRAFLTAEAKADSTAEATDTDTPCMHLHVY